MAFVPITNTCAVEVRLRMDNQRVALTLGFTRFIAPSQSEMQALADLVATWWGVNGRTLMGSHVTLYETYVRDLTSESGYSYASTLYNGTGGNLTIGTSYPANVALTISFRTDYRGRANRGRNYWFGFGTSQRQGQSTVQATYRNNLIALYQRFLPGGASDPTPFRWCVLSRQLNGVPQGRAVPIVSVLVVDDNMDSQRRRLPGRGL